MLKSTNNQWLFARDNKLTRICRWKKLSRRFRLHLDNNGWHWKCEIENCRWFWYGEWVSISYHITAYRRTFFCTNSFRKQGQNETHDYYFRYDFVRIYDGDSKEANELASLTGTGLETSIFTSSGSAITIRFQSDLSTERSGFSLEYSAGMCDI